MTNFQKGKHLRSRFEEAFRPKRASLLLNRLFCVNFCSRALDIDKDLLPQFRAHLNRGAVALFDKVKDLGDIYELIPPQR